MSGSIQLTVHTWARRLAGIGVAAALVSTGAVVTAPSSASAAAPVLFSDEFDDGDDGWHTVRGEWAVADEGYPSGPVLQQSALTTALARTGRPNWSDYAVTARVRPLEYGGKRSSIGIQARVQRDGSHYYLNARADNTLELGKVVRGRNTVLATTPHQADLGYWDSLTLVVKGSTLIGSSGGSDVVTATDTRLRTGQIALATAKTSGRFDSVTVTSYEATDPDTQAPLTPAPPKVVEVTPTTATITWSPTVDNVGVVDYVVYQGDSFYSRYRVGTFTGTGPLTLPLSPTAPETHFSIVARDAAGNTSPESYWATVPQPPSFPKSGNDTVAPSRPGNPTFGGTTADGKSIVSWAPATDNVGVVEYHIYVLTNVDGIWFMGKVQTTSAELDIPTAGNTFVRVVAYDASWNSASTAYVPWSTNTSTPTTAPAPIP